MQRYNTTLGFTEVYTGSAWVGMGTQGATGGVTSFNGNTGAIEGWQFITSGTFSAATTVNIGSLPSGYKIFRFVYYFQASSAGSAYELAHRISTNSGSSYIEDIYRYEGSGFNGTVNGNDFFVAAGAQGSLRTMKDINIGAAEPFCVLDSYLYQPVSSPSAYSWVQGQMGVMSNGNSGGSAQFTYYGTSANSSYVNGFQLVRSAGTKTLTGAYQVYGSK
jgi:hypothetical protein